jgi:lipooligosaccharide transport system permease protein
MTSYAAAAVLRLNPPALLRHRRAARLVERNYVLYRNTWWVIVSGFFEPLFYLLAVGVGIGKLVGHVHGPSGAPLDYTTFVAPALLAASAMNGAVYDSTFNVFHKLKYAKVYDAVLATPVTIGDVAIGETAWALLRGSAYAVAFLVVMAPMGLIVSPLAVLALPAALLRGLVLGGIGWPALGHAAYLAAMGAAGLLVARRRLGKLLLR